MPEISFDPFPVLETGRLILRRPVKDDIDELYKYRSDKELMRYIPHRYAADRKQVEEMMDRVHSLIATGEGINWAISLKGSDTIIGMVGYVRFMMDHYRAEIGYMLHTPWHGKGMAEEATRAAIDFGFTKIGLHSIEAIVNTANTASRKLLERIGFTNDALFKDYLYHGGAFIDANVYSLIAPPSIRSA